MSDIYKKLPKQNENVKKLIREQGGVGQGLVNGIINKVITIKDDDPRMEKHEKALEELDQAILTNRKSEIQWAREEFLPSSKHPKPLQKELKMILRDEGRREGPKRRNIFFHVSRRRTTMEWEAAYDGTSSQPAVDFTNHQYVYPEKLDAPPATLGDYPKLKPMKAIMEMWPQDDIDHPPTPFHEDLMHFDYNKPGDLEAAKKFRDAKLPFKLTNVPEVVAAGEKWTDEYLHQQFAPSPSYMREIPRTNGNAQESINNFFAFFNKDAWDTPSMGLAPTRNNDWSFEQWAKHAKYADAEGLDPNRPHFYFQAGVDREERELDYSKWTFISRDLPSFSSPKKNFFVFEIESQKGIQTR